MYINFDLAKKKGLAPIEIITLQMIFQNSSGKEKEHIAELSPDIPNRLFKEGYLTFVKAKNKKDTTYNRVRLSKKGKTVYRQITTYKLDEKDELIYKFMSEVYNKLDKGQASKKKILELIAFFRLESGLNHKEIYDLCKKFVNDEDNMEFNHKLEYVFFKPENNYSKPNLNQSRLWSYYEKLQSENKNQ